MKELLRRFFEEKNLPNQEIVIRTEEQLIPTNTETIQEIILEELSEQEQSLVWEVLQQFDWFNRDINQALINFANGLAKKYHSYLFCKEGS